MLRRFQFVLFTLLLTVSSGKAQVNLVLNPSFEDTINCPYQAGDINKASGWTSLCGSPDYFKSCNQYDWGVPVNIFGHQLAASGDAYAGFLSYSTLAPNLREFPACNLSTPLNVGTKYFISFKIALSLENIANPTNCASDKTGLRFTMGNSICSSLINNSPPVFSSSITTDSSNWTRITGTFVADSAYTMLVIGNFFDDSNTHTAKFFNSWWDDFAYYYLDDICVGTDSAFVYTFGGVTGISQGAKSMVSFYPNPATDKIFVAGEDKIRVHLCDLLGKELFATQKREINAETLEDGVYLLRIETSNGAVVTRKIVVQH